MARHFTVTLTSGTNSGPYNIYYDSTNNFAVLYGTSNNAENLTLSQVQSGVLVTVPNGANSVILYNTNAQVISDCPTNFVEYSLTGAPTSTPIPTQTSAPTATPGATANPTSTPGATANPTATPAPTGTPGATANPTATPGATANPTPTPSSTETLYYYNAICRSGCLSESSEQLQAAPAGSIVVQYTQQINLGQYVGLVNNQGCWEILTEASAPAADTVNSMCANPTATPTPSPSPTPSPTAGIACVEYSYDDTGSFGDPDRIIIFTNCQGNADSFSFPPGGYGTFCAQQGSVSVQNTTTVTLEGDCTTGGVGPTSTPHPTSTPTPSATGSGSTECYEFSWSDSGSLGDPNGFIQYVDCDGVGQNMTVSSGGYGTICARSITNVSARVTYTNDGTAGCLPTAQPTATAQPTPTPTPETLYRYYISTAVFTADTNDFCTQNYSANTAVWIGSSVIPNTLSKNVYSDSSGTTLFTGAGGRMYFIDTVFNGASTNGGYTLEIAGGEVLNVIGFSCDGGGGGNPLNEEVGTTPTP